MRIRGGGDEGRGQIDVKRRLLFLFDLFVSVLVH